MDFGLSEEQQQLKTSARELLAAECPAAAVRKAMASDDGTLPELWREIAKLGWTGLIVPEKFGGAGLGMLDMVVLLEEQGYAAMPGPFLFSAAMATEAVVRGGSEEMKAKWLGALAQGQAIGTVAFAETSDRIPTLAKEGRLSGSKVLVPYAKLADFMVVAARGEAGRSLVLVDPHLGGVRVNRLSHLDLTRRFGSVDFSAAAAEPLSGGESLLGRIFDVGAVSIAADSLGGMQRALDMAVDYSKVREQFGKPIGSFQALKHAAAEIVADLEPARSLVWYAAHALDAMPGEAPRAAAMAKARLCEVYSRGTDRAVLMHGGIGFTWEHDIHLWFKRARFNESYLGSPTYHRERVAQLSAY
jgi:alkylation response protein AidB-like acyl-CoA dehydrogenase